MADINDLIDVSSSDDEMESIPLDRTCGPTYTWFPADMNWVITAEMDEQIAAHEREAFYICSKLRRSLPLFGRSGHLYPIWGCETH